MTREEASSEPNDSPKKADVDPAAMVDRTLKDSFPASDPPGWTPIVATSAPADLSDGEAESWHPLGNSTIEWAMGWAQHAVELLDACLFSAFTLAHLTDDVQFRVGAGVHLSGRKAVCAWFEESRAFGLIAHRITSITADEDDIVIESDVSYLGADGKTVTLPQAMSCKLRGDRASRIQIYGAPAMERQPSVQP